jgi:hypothetical protein
MAAGDAVNAPNAKEIPPFRSAAANAFDAVATVELDGEPARVEVHGHGLAGTDDTHDLGAGAASRLVGEAGVVAFAKGEARRSLAALPSATAARAAGATRPAGPTAARATRPAGPTATGAAWSRTTRPAGAGARAARKTTTRGARDDAAGEGKRECRRRNKFDTHRIPRKNLQYEIDNAPVHPAVPEATLVRRRLRLIPATLAGEKDDETASAIAVDSTSM